MSVLGEARLARLRASAHHVYRCYDASGRLVYVGCSASVYKRLDDHRRTSWWADQVVSVKAVVHPNQALARVKEHKAIVNEHPRWNVGGRWRYRHVLNEAQYRDYLYANLRAGWVHPGHQRFDAMYVEYQEKFRRPLVDPRIDGYEWPSPTGTRYCLPLAVGEPAPRRTAA